MTASRWIITVSVLAVLAAPMPAKAAPQLVQQGINDYNSGHYRQAVICLAESIKGNPNDALVHYYLANALARIGKHEQAEAEYEIAYRLQPNGQIAKYCLAVLQRYSGVMPVHYGSIGDTKYDITNGNDDSGVSHTEFIIKRQATYEKHNTHQLGEAYANDFLSQGEHEARQIQAQAELDMQQALEPPVVQLGKSCVTPPTFSPQLARARASQIQRAAIEEIAQARRAAQCKAEQYRRWTRDRDDALDDVVSSLESQLEEPGIHSGVKLQAVGTDLYTRYYGASRTTAQLPDVHPTVVRIIEHQANQYSLKGPEDNESGDTTLHTTRSVHGKILN